MKNRIASGLGAVLVAAFLNGSAVRAVPSDITESSSDYAAVYDTVLASWLKGQGWKQNVADELGPPPRVEKSELEDCTDGLTFPEEPTAQGPKTLSDVQLSAKKLVLVDGSQWKPVDPSQSIARGTSIRKSVKEGFKHSLLSLSQIAFSSDGKDALVKIGIVCGALCGSGATVLLHRKPHGWATMKECRRWIS